MNIRKEAQGTARASETVQYRVMRRVLDSGEPREVKIDDDDAGEAVDVVAI